ncbi:hypothetical protein KC336_g20277, partial [Hortaea werneckii]
SRTAKSVPKALRRLDAAEKLTHSGQNTKRGALPNLGKLTDVSDYLLDPHAADGFTSDSEPDTDAEVEVLAPSTQKLQRKATRKAPGAAADDGPGEGAGGGGTRHDRRDPRSGRTNVERKAIKLHELGPRMRLRLTKVEEGLCGGRVMWHEYIHKTAAELREMEKLHEGRRREKERRREEQRRNLERKRAERRGRGEEEVQSGDEEEMDDEDMLDEEEEDEWEDDGMEGEE